MSIWRERARSRIAELVRDLPADATVAERRKALWGKGWEAHQGTVWGRKMWGREVRAYLAQRGATPRHDPAPMFPDHVHFPFREERNAQG